MVTKEEILKYAEETYPVGTKFISPFDKRTYTVMSYNIVNQKWLSTDTLIVFVKEKLGFGDYLLYHGEWAKIVSLPKLTINSFEIW